MPANWFSKAALWSSKLEPTTQTDGKIKCLKLKATNRFYQLVFFWSPRRYNVKRAYSGLWSDTVLVSIANACCNDSPR